MIDMRSDTVTRPSEAMRQAMANAEVGDDFYRDDPTVDAFQAYAAELFGKEAALYVPSGTMGNLLSHLTHCPGGAEVVAPATAHTFRSEAGGAARFGGMLAVSVPQTIGRIYAASIAAAIRPRGILMQGTGLIWVEQPTFGHVVPLADLEGVRRVADEHGLPIHMDGARIFNAATYLGVPVSQVAAHADTVMSCVSKGLAAPIGSLLLGTRDFVERARYHRLALGGGMRQAGLIAAAGLYALRHNVQRLAEDHANARVLADGLSRIPGVEIDRQEVQTNIFATRSDSEVWTSGRFAAELRERGILVNWNRAPIRFVTHYGIERPDVEQVIDAAAEILGAPSAAAQSARSG